MDTFQEKKSKKVTCIEYNILNAKISTLYLTFHLIWSFIEFYEVKITIFFQLKKQRLGKLRNTHKVTWLINVGVKT